MEAMHLNILFFIINFLLFPNILYAEVYKWVDEDGKVHFSDKPKNKNAKKFIYDPKVISQETFKKNNDKKPKNSISKRNEFEAKQQNELKNYHHNQTEKQKRYCGEAKEDLIATQNSQLLYNYDKNGKRYFLNEKQRLKVLEKKTKIVKKWCGS